MKFNDYFKCTVEYPDLTIEMLTPGVRLSYISSSFLDGWINCVTPVSAFLITRYQSHTENLEKIAQCSYKHHARLREFGDDVLILASSPRDQKLAREKYATDEQFWWFFWFDNDVFDCEIGRFQTPNSGQQVKESFEIYAQETSLKLSKHYSGNEDCTENREGKPALKIELSSYGWIEF